MGKHDMVSSALLRKLFECEGILTETCCLISSEKGEKGAGEEELEWEWPYPISEPRG